MADVQLAARPNLAQPQTSQATIEDLQDERKALVEQYVAARPTGSDGWTRGAGIGLGLVGAGIGLGGILLANRGRNAMYQGLNLMFGGPAAMLGGGAVGYLVGSRLGELSTRPTGPDAARQVGATRDELRRQIAEVDDQLRAADGRRPSPLPEIDDHADVSLARVGMHAGAGLGIGLFATAGTIAGVEALRGGGRIPGGPTFIAALAAPAVAAGAISYLDQRDEANGGQGSTLRAAGIGAAAMGAASLMPAFSGIPVPLRLAGGAALGALLGTTTHLVSASSRD